MKRTQSHCYSLGGLVVYNSWLRTSPHSFRAWVSYRVVLPRRASTTIRPPYVPRALVPWLDANALAAGSTSSRSGTHHRRYQRKLLTRRPPSWCCPRGGWRSVLHRTRCSPSGSILNFAQPQGGQKSQAAAKSVASRSGATTSTGQGRATWCLANGRWASYKRIARHDASAPSRNHGTATHNRGQLERALGPLRRPENTPTYTNAQKNRHVSKAKIEEQDRRWANGVASSSPVAAPRPLQ
jgi:hypothetical protein